MAFLDVVGEVFGFTSNKGWSLVGQDPQVSTLNFTGDFIAENQSESVGSRLDEQGSLNKPKPNFQWLGGEAEAFQFQSRIWARDSFTSVKPQIELLKSMARRNKDLRRAPIFLFTSGTEIGFTCFVKGVQFEYDEHKADGSIQGAVVSIGLQKIDDTIVQAAATSLAAQIKQAAGIVAAAAGIGSIVGRIKNIAGFSVHTLGRDVTVKSGETFESIAKREYGSALIGDILRRAQPDKFDLKVGDKIFLIEPSEARQIRVTQQSVSQKDTVVNQQLKNDFFELRNRKTTIFV